MNPKIDIEANSLKEAREIAESRVPEGLLLLSESIISDENPKEVIIYAETTDIAFQKAQNDIPSNAEVLKKKILINAENKTVKLEAENENIARAKILEQTKNTAIVKACKLTIQGKKGFFGLGKTLSHFEFDIFQQAAVSVTYKTKAKISVWMGETDGCCDVCYKKLGNQEGYLLTTENVVSSPAYWKKIIPDHIRSMEESLELNRSSRSSDSATDEQMLQLAIMAAAHEKAGKPNPWMVCNECINLFPIDKKLTHDYAIKRYKSGGQYSGKFCPPGSGPAPIDKVKMS